MKFKNVKIVVFVPLSHCDIVRKAIGDANGGHIGNYSYTSFSSKGIGRFKANEKAHPYTGNKNKIAKVEEERIEFICQKEKAKKIIDTIKKVHPYEEVALDIYPILDEKEL
jgi:hypothetical protein